MAWAPDGREILVAGDGRFRVLNAESGDERCSSAIDQVTRILVAADGSRAVTVGRYSSSITSWDLSTCSRLGDIPGLPDGHFVLTPDAQRLVTLRMGLHDGAPQLTLATWNLEDGRMLTDIQMPTGPDLLTPGGVTPDGRRAILVQENQLHLHDVSTGARLSTITVPGTMHITPRAISDDGHTILLTRLRDRDPTASLGEALVGLLASPLEAWDLETGERRWIGPNLIVTEGEVLSADGRLLAGPFVGDGDDSLLVYDLPTGRKVAEVEYDGDAIPRVVAFSPDGRKLAVVTTAQQLHLYAVSVD
jgi:WD40 repeat protein